MKARFLWFCEQFLLLRVGWNQAPFEQVFPRSETRYASLIHHPCSPGLEFIVLRGHFDAEALAKRSNVIVIILIKLIPRVKLHHPFWRYTLDRIAVHRTGPGKRFSRVFDSVNMITC